MSSNVDALFLQHAEECMRGLQAKLDTFDPDEIEADLGSGVLRITFSDGRSCILKRQAAAHQIWLAEGATAWHFVHAPERDAWVDTKGRGDLLTILAGILTRRVGRPIEL